ncbi:MAG: 3-hydroxyacyl-CoA dehydrogenase family protein [Clostridiales Family XIII bacterium]|jgi:3-hydroxyacyl-CoA dehydrogenase|nr:3-hydroxyacyl-CoA dehydrogenase family protein [Clostridiales Family XIII bacterium]
MRAKIRKAVVLGAGTMGAAIAGHLAGAGVAVTLLDRPCEDGPAKNKFSMDGKKRILDPKSRLLYARSEGDLISVGNFADDLEKAADADWVVEAVVESLEAKRDLFAQVAKYVRKDCILSSNTSGISVNAIAEAVPAELRPQFLGTHFFNPPRYMTLLELIPAKETDPALVEAFAGFAEHRLGKTVLIANDIPNFVANRIGSANALLIFSGMEKYALTPAMVNLLTGSLIGRPPAGTLRSCDMIGLDIVQSTCVTNSVIENDPAEKDLMCGTGYFAAMIERGDTGKKAGQGFFKKSDGGEMMLDCAGGGYVPYEEPDLPALSVLGKKAPMKERIYAVLDSHTAAGDFLWYLLKWTFSYCANRVPEITEDFRTIDLAMQLGYNWTYGPFQLWEILGIMEIKSRMERDGIVLPAWVGAHLPEHGNSFYGGADFSSIIATPLSIHDPSLPVVWSSDEVILKDLGDGIGCIALATRGTVP